MNNGLSVGSAPELKVAYPDVTPVSRPVIRAPKTIDPDWLAGFSSGESNFSVSIKNVQAKVGGYVELIFQLSQNSRDLELLKSILDFFGCGYLYFNVDRNALNFRISKFSDIVNKIIPFFEAHRIIGVKAQDFEDFKKVAEIMEVKGQFTDAGLAEIRQIKEGMNSGREEIPEDDMSEGVMLVYKKP